MRVKLNDAFELGKKRIAKENHHINIMVYRDYVGTFILVKGKRIPVKDKIVNKRRVFFALWN